MFTFLGYMCTSIWSLDHSASDSICEYNIRQRVKESLKGLKAIVSKIFIIFYVYVNKDVLGSQSERKDVLLKHVNLHVW